MGLIRRIIGIPETKHIYLKDSIVSALRKVLPDNKHDFFESLILREFLKLGNCCVIQLLKGFEHMPAYRKMRLEGLPNTKL